MRNAIYEPLPDVDGVTFNTKFPTYILAFCPDSDSWFATNHWYHMNRNLDGCYFRIERDGKWQNVCFSDLTRTEQERVMDGKNAEWLKSLCIHLANQLTMIGSQFDIVGENDDE